VIDKLLAADPIRVEPDIGAIFGNFTDHDLIPQLIDMWDGEPVKSDRLIVEVLAEYQIDHRRSCLLFRVRMDGQVFAIGQRAGRELRDYSRYHVLDLELYRAATIHVNSLLLGRAEVEPPRSCGGNDWLDFYGEKLRLGEKLVGRLL
jgi:hypothetical protein